MSEKKKKIVKKLKSIFLKKHLLLPKSLEDLLNKGLFWSPAMSV